MNDFTMLNPSTKESECILEKCEELLKWARMMYKPKKSRSYMLQSGKLDVQYIFAPNREPITTVSEQPVMSLDKCYIDRMKDIKRSWSYWIWAGL